MKRILNFSLSLACVFSVYASKPVENDTVKNNESDYAANEDECFKKFEDSIYSLLYPPVYPQKLDPSKIESADSNKSPNYTETQVSDANTVNGTFVPTTFAIDKSKGVGEIEIISGTTPGGAKTYQIPIKVYDGIKGMQPDLSLTYNSQGANSTLGYGWTLSGLSLITRGNRSYYYDGKASGKSMNCNDVFILDGTRFIETGRQTGSIFYESEFGNIKARGVTSGEVLKYFEVFFPNGNKGIYGYAASTQNSLSYPLTTLKDIKGNKIEFTYDLSNNLYNIKKIAYGGASLEFEYSSRQDPILLYDGGTRTYNEQLLTGIVSKFGLNPIGRYDLKYTARNSISLLTEVGYSAFGKSLNPILFYYGNGTTPSHNFTKTTTQLTEWYTSESPSMIKVEKGKFDYYSGSDGLIVLPNNPTYWESFKDPNAVSHSHKFFKNYYNGDEEIYLYAGLNEEYSYPLKSIFTGEGFIDIFCADLEGKQEECVIKVNNVVAGGLDQLTFTVYRANVYGGLTERYKRTYSFPTVYTDASKNKSIQPKYYYPGDFNGDGRMDVLAVSAHEPFAEVTLPTVCYIFDLENNTILYQGNLLKYHVEFVGSRHTDPDEAANNTDTLIALDYDGDGKTDLCHINDNGTDVYTFEYLESKFIGRRVGTYTSLSKSNLKDCIIMAGEFNGDGLMDLLVSPPSSPAKYSWSIYFSMGNGQFDKTSFNWENYSKDTNVGFIIQDVNCDGKTDLTKYDSYTIKTSFAENNMIRYGESCGAYKEKDAIVIPTDINSHNTFSQLLSLSGGVVSKYSYPFDDRKDLLASGMINSFGVIEHNNYVLTTQAGSSVCEVGGGASFPYVNINEPFHVLSLTVTFLNNTIINRDTYSYSNAIIHRQGLGFCGFQSISSMNIKNQRTTRTYNPFLRGALISEKSPFAENTYSYDASYPNKIARINLTNRIEKDLLKDLTCTYSYVYDSYGFPTSEIMKYPDGITVKKENTYAAKPSPEDGYYLGYLIKQNISTTRNGSTYQERMHIPATAPFYPTLKLYFKDNNQVKQIIYSYDSYGNVTSEKIRNFNSQNTLENKYVFDQIGRIVKETDPEGFVKEYTYDSYGLKKSETDRRGGKTIFSYDEFRRKTYETHPDSTIQSYRFIWSTDLPNAMYSVINTATGKPYTVKVYDALNREIRNSETRFDGSVKKNDKRYDTYGNLSGESLPFKDSSALFWNTRSYDNYDRLVSVEEASGRKTTYSYSGNSTTTVSDSVSVTRNFDSLGNLISVTDPAGTITYQLNADSQPSSITSPGDIVTSFTYDKYRRRISLSDPSLGAIQYEYDNNGYLTKTTNADGGVVEYEYDPYGNILAKSTPEFITDYTYNEFGDLTAVFSDNGTSKSFSYDQFGRLSFSKECVEDKWLRKDYTYSNGNISSIKYTTQSGELATENYFYLIGHLYKGKLNGETTVFEIVKENAFGQPIEVKTGEITRYYSFTTFGIPAGRYSRTTEDVFENSTYSFDASTNNLLSRTDNKSSISEKFTYDNLNRLASYGDKVVSYDEKGNITCKSDVGNFDYAISEKPFAVSGLTVTGDSISTATQTITYTSFARPSAITENDKKATFLYNSDYERVRMLVYRPLQAIDSIVLNKEKSVIVSRAISTNYYLGDCLEMDDRQYSSTERLYLFGDYYTAPAVYVKEKYKPLRPTPTPQFALGDSIGTIPGTIHPGDLVNFNTLSKGVNYIIRDFLGSITHVVNSDYKLVQKLSYDPWGRLRNTKTQEAYAPGSAPAPVLGRGYAGHEHLPYFGLINMNARLYDPALGRFLSPDPYVQMPEMSQNFNRYTYAMNNPFRYKDPNGELFLFTYFTAVTDFFSNLFKHGFKFKKYNWDRTKNSFKITMGMFHGNFGQVVNKWTWGFFNSSIGMGMSQIYNFVGKVDGVTDMDGMLALSGATKGSAAMTIGHYSLGPDGYQATWKDHLFVHEYGHYIQTQQMGPFFFPVVAIPSLLSAAFTSKWCGMDHSERWFEANASKLGGKHFDKKYGRDKEGNSVNDEYHFNYDSFSKGLESSYSNPRTGLHNGGQFSKSYPTSKTKIVFWDFIL